MVDEAGLGDHLADLAASGQRFAGPPAAEQIRARGDQRRRRKHAALTSGGVVLTAALAMGVLSPARPGPEPAPAAAKPTPSRMAPRFVPPSPGPGEEYASEIGYVYDAMRLEENTVRITVEHLRTGVVHQVTLPTRTPVEVKHVAGGRPGDMRMGELVDRLRAGPRWVFALDYDGEGRIASLREAFWLAYE